MSITFRKAIASDTEILVGFMRGLYLYDHSHFDEAGCRKALSLLIGNEAFGGVWLIDSKETAIGYIVVTFGFSLEFHGRDAFIDELFISEAYRKQGIGKQAISFAEEICKSLGIEALHLEVERDNTNAQAVYRRVGFVDHSRYLLTKWLSQESSIE